MKLLVSACLMGQPVRYDGRANDDKTDNFRHQLQRWQKAGILIPVCPEVAGGLPTPRPAAEIIQGDGSAVLQGKARIISRSAEDFTREFISGAQQALTCAQHNGVVAALLAARSPSCGSDGIYNGEFNATLRQGMGVTAALLSEHGIPCFSLERFSELLQWLRQQHPMFARQFIDES
ncbi:MAG: DUF523 domain-containing protein [Saccharospirillaceae bacterium]|nr:DUF523 domain-containing protein [Saccharospirillaceae bacterium]MCD8532826.1 DUF523 domain-containing protein [Saccharospirillaceae bacterium]